MIVKIILKRNPSISSVIRSSMELIKSYNQDIINRYISNHRTITNFHIDRICLSPFTLLLINLLLLNFHYDCAIRCNKSPLLFFFTVKFLNNINTTRHNQINKTHNFIHKCTASKFDSTWK